MSLYDEVYAKLDHPKPGGDGFIVSFCPIHESSGNGHHASLRIKPATQVDNGVILTCMGGCARDDLATALGLTECHSKSSTSDDNTHLFWVPNGNGAAKPVGKHIVATYDYTDEKGTLLYQKVRYEPKTFAQRRPYEGNWAWGITAGEYAQNNEGDWWKPQAWTPDTAPRRTLLAQPQVLFRLSQLADADEVVVAEGEKAVIALESIGLVATCSSGGQMKWPKHLTKYLVGKRVIVVPDNDEQGREGAIKVIAALRRADIKCCTVRLPDLPAKGDPYDAVKEGLTEYDFSLLVAAAFERREDTEDQAEFREARHQGEFNEVWLADCFSDQFPDLVVHVPEQGKLTPSKGLRIFHEGVFIQDRVLLMQLAEKTVMGVYEAAANADEHDRKLLRLAANRYDKSDTLGSLLTRVALRAPRVTLDEFDQDPDHLCCANGVADLRTGEFLPHSPTYRWTVKTRANYDPDARCPVWDAHLDKIIGSPDEIFALQRLLGYALTGYTSEQVMALAIGTGANGKSVTFNAIAYVLGGYAADADAKTFSLRGNDAIREDIAKLREKRFVTSFERHHRKVLDESFIKQITGGDKVHGCFKYEHEFEFTPQFKVFLSVNDTPTVEVADFALMRRLLFIPFSVTIPRSEWDTNIDRKLKSEADGILAWMVRGAMDYLREGFTIPERWAVASEEYKTRMDPLHGFGELITVEDGVWTSTADIHEAMVHWATDEGMKTPPGRESLGHWISKLSGAQAHSKKVGRRLVRGWNIVVEGANVEQTMDI